MSTNSTNADLRLTILYGKLPTVLSTTSSTLNLEHYASRLRQQFVAKGIAGRLLQYDGKILAVMEGADDAMQEAIAYFRSFPYEDYLMLLLDADSSAPTFQNWRSNLAQAEGPDPVLAQLLKHRLRMPEVPTVRALFELLNDLPVQQSDVDKYGTSVLELREWPRFDRLGTDRGLMALCAMLVGKPKTLHMLAERNPFIDAQTLTETIRKLYDEGVLKLNYRFSALPAPKTPRSSGFFDRMRAFLLKTSKA